MRSSGCFGIVLFSTVLIAVAHVATAWEPVALRVDFAPADPRASLSVATDLRPAPDPSVVHLAVFYAQELLERGHSLASLDEALESMIRYTHEGLANSGVPLTFRVTYAGIFSERLDGIDTFTAHTVLGDRVQSLRDSLLTDFGADAVVLIKATDDADHLFGFATIGTESSLSDPSTVPHAVVCLGPAQTSGLECFGRGGIFAHEVGHLFGAGHQRNAAVGGFGGAFEFSFAAGCGGGTILFSPITLAQQLYSTPSVVVDGVPCGVPASEGPDGEDNAETINLTRSLMADLRPAMPTAGSVSIDGPGDLAIAEGGPAQTLMLRRDGNLNEPAGVALADISSGGTTAELRIDPSEVVFAPGEEVVAVQISAVDDTIVENTESVEVGLRNPLRLEMGAGTVRVAITDNDEPPSPPAPPPQPRSGGGSLTSPGLIVLLAIVLLSMPSQSRRRWF